MWCLYVSSSTFINIDTSLESYEDRNLESFEQNKLIIWTAGAERWWEVTSLSSTGLTLHAKLISRFQMIQIGLGKVHALQAK